MPDISLPEVRLKDRLPEGLRDMTIDDIQKAIPEVHLPRIDLGRDAAKARQAAEKAAAKAAKQAEKAARDAQKSASREAAKAARNVEHALPFARRQGPNPVPIAILAMLGGLVVGWLLATNPTTRARISGWFDDLRMRREAGGRGVGGEEWDTSEPVAYPESLRSPIESDRFATNLSTADTGVAVGPGQLPEGMGTSDPARVGADDRA
jgi:hypothetical protein